MSFLSSVFKAIVGIVQGIIKSVLSIVRKLLPLIIVIVALYFMCPALAAGLAEIGAPAWMTSAVSAFPAFVDGAISSVTGFISKSGTSLWNKFIAADLSTKMMVVGAAGLAFAPEQTVDAITQTGTAVGDAIGGVVTGVVGGLTGMSIPTLAVVGLATWWFFFRKKDKEDAPKKEEPNVKA